MQLDAARSCGDIACLVRFVPNLFGFMGGLIVFPKGLINLVEGFFPFVQGLLITCVYMICFIGGVVDAEGMRDPPILSLKPSKNVSGHVT
jgi:hypothetical protein